MTDRLQRRVDGLLAGPGWLLVIVAIYLLIHFGIRFLVSPTLTLDDAEQALFSQELLLGYRFRQPPVYTWVLWGVAELVGHNLIAHSIVRYGLQFFGYLFLFLAARRLIGEPRLAVLAVFSYSLIYVFGYYVHHDLTHTVAVATLIAATFWLFTRAVEMGRWLDWGLLGLVLGLGFLAKYNFILLPLAALPAILLTPPIRRVVLQKKALLALGVMAVVLAPYFTWVVGHEYSFLDLSARVTHAAPAAAEIDSRLLAVGNFFVKAAEFTLPFLILVPLLLPQVLKREPIRPEDRYQYGRFMLVLMLSGLVILAAAVIGVGASHFKARWFHPILMMVPIYTFWRLRGLELPVHKVARFLMITAALAAFAMVARVAFDRIAPSYCGSCRAFIPFADLAADMTVPGFEPGTIVSETHHVAGNLRLGFPGARVVDTRYPIFAFPEPETSASCLLIWRGDVPQVPESMRAYLAESLNVENPPRDRSGYVEHGYYGATDRRYGLSYRVIPQGVGDCR